MTSLFPTQWNKGYLVKNETISTFILGSFLFLFVDINNIHTYGSIDQYSAVLPSLEYLTLSNLNL